MAKLSSSSSSSSNSHHHLGHFPLWFLSALRAAKMEGKASGILKQVRHQLASFANAKLAAVKSKTSAVKTQLIIFRLLHDRKALMSAISHKIHTLIMSSKRPEQQEAGAAASSSDNGSKMIARHNAPSPPTEASCDMCSVESAGSTATCREIISTAEDYANHLISHSVNFDDEAVSGDGTAGSSDINVGKDQSQLIREEQLGDQFVQLEEEIDQVAELFIKRIRRQMMLERLESFRRHQLQEGGA